VGDGLLDTRGQRARSALAKTAYGTGPSLLLAAIMLVLGAGLVGWAVAFVGGLLGLSIATSVRTEKGALVAGVIVAIGLLVVQIAVAWLFAHPILCGS